MGKNGKSFVAMLQNLMRQNIVRKCFIDDLIPHGSRKYIIKFIYREAKLCASFLRN
jgi:hypothetical protein